MRSRYHVTRRTSVRDHVNCYVPDTRVKSLRGVRLSSQVILDSHDFGAHRCGNDIFVCHLARFHTLLALCCRNDGMRSWSDPWCQPFLIQQKMRSIPYHSISDHYQLKKETPWPYPWPPIVYCQNLQHANAIWGYGDL